MMVKKNYFLFIFTIIIVYEFKKMKKINKKLDYKN